MPEQTPAEFAKWLFAQKCEFVTSAVDVAGMPAAELPEIAFAGRSNVGKSSLINSLLGRKSLARTSRTPGRTQQINFFNLHNTLMVVDLPGYGYAQAPKKLVQNWTKLVSRYLKGRVPLKRVYLLIDSRHGLKEVDRETMKLLNNAAVSYQIVLTKADKIKPNVLQTCQTAIEKELEDNPAALPQVISTSSVKKHGMDELREAIAAII